MGSFEAQSNSAIDIPFEVEMVGDEVVFIGPGPVAFAMSYAAARQTAERLRDVLAAAEELGAAATAL